jgi:hypothetical protein
MIENFEEITKELNQEELKLVPVLIEKFSNHSYANPIKAPDIVNEMNNNIGCSNALMTGPRLRKLCNHIRSNGLLPLIATSKGYFISTDKDVIKSQIRSLRQRANSINNCADGLEEFIIPKVKIVDYCDCAEPGRWPLFGNTCVHCRKTVRSDAEYYANTDYVKDSLSLIKASDV